jgi:DNA-binding SARP family transcriptional activator
VPSTARDPTLLQLLGPVYLRRLDGSPLPRPLTQPRPLAVLAYLALARPRGLHSRDTILALLWPESTQASGRHALRNALHAIRYSLGDDALVTAGDGLVGLDPARVRCDALELE